MGVEDFHEPSESEVFEQALLGNELPLFDFFPCATDVFDIRHILQETAKAAFHFLQTQVLLPRHGNPIVNQGVSHAFMLPEARKKSNRSGRHDRVSRDRADMYAVTSERTSSLPIHIQWHVGL